MNGRDLTRFSTGITATVLEDSLSVILSVTLSQLICISSTPLVMSGRFVPYSVCLISF